jgi:hypothetical protein
VWTTETRTTTADRLTAFAISVVPLKYLTFEFVRSRTSVWPAVDGSASKLHDVADDGAGLAAAELHDVGGGQCLAAGLV